MLRPIDHDIFVPAGDCASQPGAAETLRRLFLSQCSSRTPTAATIHRQPIRSGCNTPPCSSSRRIWQTAPWRSADAEDRKSTRLNSSHGYISYAVFCLKKKKDDTNMSTTHS